MQKFRLLGQQSCSFLPRLYRSEKNIEERLGLLKRIKHQSSSVKSQPLLPIRSWFQFTIIRRTYRTVPFSTTQPYQNYYNFHRLTWDQSLTLNKEKERERERGSRQWSGRGSKTDVRCHSDLSTRRDKKRGILRRETPFKPGFIILFYNQD